MKDSNKAPHTTTPKTTPQSATRSQVGKTGSDQVSELTTNRLSVYLRCLNALEEAGVRTISSQALAEQIYRQLH